MMPMLFVKIQLASVLLPFMTMVVSAVSMKFIGMLQIQLVFFLSFNCSPMLFFCLFQPQEGDTTLLVSSQMIPVLILTQIVGVESVCATTIITERDLCVVRFYQLFTKNEQKFWVFFYLKHLFGIILKYS